jgi:ABC-type transport system involved in cytochrome c biogenesis ATPase subunit
VLHALLTEHAARGGCVLLTSHLESLPTTPPPRVLQLVAVPSA